MAKTSDEVKFQRPQKFRVRHRNRCPKCGRARGFIRRFGLCRLCSREEINKGNFPGVRKYSW